MQLTPLSDADRTAALAQMRLHLASGAAAALDRIAATVGHIPAGIDLPSHRAAAVDLAHAFGIPTIAEAPAAAFSWDGTAVRTISEASVLFHEIAHWQIAPAERRPRRDFGLGAGPETGRAAEANADRAADDATKQREETLASLLGILWEAEHQQPAVLAFLEQNWLEGWQRRETADFFADTLAELSRRGLARNDGVPIPPAGYRPGSYSAFGDAYGNAEDRHDIIAEHHPGGSAMAYTLDDLIKDCRDSLQKDSGEGGQEEVRQHLEKLCQNQAFIDENCPPDAPRGVHVLYTDPDYDFQVLNHIYEGGVTSPPHDHGNSWAVYCQAREYTDMTLWNRLDDGSKEPEALVQPVEVFRLNPGQAGRFSPGVIHSIQFPDGARFIRITGTDLEQIERRTYNVKEKTVKVIESNAAVAAE